MTKADIHQDPDAIEAFGQERPLRALKLGWWVSTGDGDTTSFDEVSMVAHGTDTRTGRDVVHARMVSHKDPDCAIEAAGYADDMVMCLTKAEAKKAGLVAASREVSS